MSEESSVDRRDFLKLAATGAAGFVAASAAADGQVDQSTATTGAAAAAGGNDPEVMFVDRPGSDFMADVIKSLGFEYVFSNPGASFRSLQESLVNYGRNKGPEWLTCCHEESSVAMAHGYFKADGKPAAVMAHGTVGLQHAAMGIYNAYCDRVPVYIILGNTLDATFRRPGIEWAHSVQDAASMVRDYTKWDDMPMSLGHFSESAVRAYKIAMTPPMMPVVLVVDSQLQEDPVGAGVKLQISRLTIPTPPAGDPAAVRETAKMLVAADNPVLIADRLGRTANGMALLVELAEALQAPVVDSGARMNFPTRHPLNHSDRRTAVLGSADVVLGLELWDFWGDIHSQRDQQQRTVRSNTKAGAKLISISTGDLFIKGNYQDFQRFQEVDLAIAADAEETLPSLIEEVKRLLTPDRKRTAQDRGAKLAAARQQAHERMLEDARYGWDATPISHARIAAELWDQIKSKDWALVGVGPGGGSPRKMWKFDKYYQHIGGNGGGGIGYQAPAAVGAALAHRKHGRLCVNFQNDGDLMYAPGALWTAAHHRIPMLTVMNNNRGYHQEVMHLQKMAARHNRDITTANIGCSIDDPNIDYAKLAQSMGWYAEGPITDPKDLGPAIKRAIAAVERGEPALLDTVTQPR